MNAAAVHEVDSSGRVEAVRPPAPWRPSWAVFATQQHGLEDEIEWHLRRRAQERAAGPLCAGSAWWLTVPDEPGDGVFACAPCSQLEGHAGRCRP